MNSSAVGSREGGEESAKGGVAMVTELAGSPAVPVNGRRSRVAGPAVRLPRSLPVGRDPIPLWGAELARRGDPKLPHLAVDEIPAGLWVRAPGDAAPSEPAYAIPVDPRRMVVVVSRPGGQPPSAAEVCRVVLTLPPALWQRMVLAPYGPLPGGEAFGAVVAAALGREMLVLTGLPLDAAEGRQVVAFSGDGAASWRPFARELVYRPAVADPPEVIDWLHPGPGLRAAGSEVVPLDSRWVAEVVAAGLWLRPTYRTDGAELVRSLPVDPSRCLVVLGSTASHTPPPPAAVVQRLCDALAADARAVLRLAVPEARLLSRRNRRPRRDQPTTDGPLALRADGTLLPASQLPDQLHRPRRSRLWRRNGPAGQSLVDTSAAASAVPPPVVAAAAVSVPDPDAGTLVEQQPELPLAGDSGSKRDDRPRVVAPIDPPPTVPVTRPTPQPAATTPVIIEPAQLTEPALATPAPNAATLPIRSEKAAPAPQVALAEIIAPILRELGRPSTAVERDRTRAWLCGRYDVFAQTLTRLVAQRPGMRVVAQQGDGDALRTDLTAICSLLGDDPAPLAGNASDAPAALRAYLICAAAGLRWLPSLPGAVFCPADRPDSRWRPGATLTVHEFLTGTSDVRARFGTPAEWVIWSMSGRRLDELVDPRRRDEVVFGPGTRFAVLAVEPDHDDGRPARVFLAELPAVGGPHSTRSDRVRERLQAAARRRDTVAEGARIRVPDRERPRLAADPYTVDDPGSGSDDGRGDSGDGRRAE